MCSWKQTCKEGISVRAVWAGRGSFSFNYSTSLWVRLATCVAYEPIICRDSYHRHPWLTIFVTIPSIHLSPYPSLLPLPSSSSSPSSSPSTGTYHQNIWKSLVLLLGALNVLAGSHLFLGWISTLPKTQPIDEPTINSLHETETTGSTFIHQLLDTYYDPAPSGSTFWLVKKFAPDRTTNPCFLNPKRTSHKQPLERTSKNRKPLLWRRWFSMKEQQAIALFLLWTRNWPLTTLSYSSSIGVSRRERRVLRRRCKVSFQD